MALQSWLRAKARAAVDGLFCSSSPYVQRIGDKDSGWVIHTSPLPVVCYCAGVGKGISFELELAKIAPRPVLVFDPSPTGIATIEQLHTANLTFYPVGLAAQSGTVEFSLPLDPGEGSYSVAREGIQTIAFDCWDLPAIMRQHGDHSIDLLKMDIEGFEYDIVDRLLDQGIPIRQICVEFHPWLAPGRTWKTIARLYKAGYRIIHKHRGDHTFLIKDHRFIQLMQIYSPSPVRPRA
ncbi:MAG: FkbM family methyltransferase [Acidobacteriaceae bacterium]|jgi:FkbM family methyltransferase